MQLTDAERWILMNQFEILSRLDPDEEAYYQRARQVIERGWARMYSWYVDLQDEIPAHIAGEVFDILDMFTAIQRGPDVPDKPVFRGFDGNHETDHFGLAHFLIYKEGKWGELRDSGDELNSHGPTLEEYRAMLEVWKGMGDRHELTEGQLSRLADAGGP